MSVSNSVCCWPISRFGSPELKQAVLPELAAGTLGGFCLTEPEAGSDAGSMRTSARKVEGGWVLDGEKAWITNAGVAKWFVTLAKSDPDAGKRGITAFVVEHGTKGFGTSKHLEKLGCRSSDTAELTLEDVRVSDAQRVGEIDHGFTDTMKILDRGRISIAAMALGLGQGALDMALAYAKERKQFGKAIGDFQAIQWMLADSRTELDAAHLLTYRAAWLADQGLPFSKEASMAKLYASEAATRACNRALQVHGGYGYTREFHVERHLRDVKLCEIGEGTSEVQRMVIAKHLLRA